MKLNEKLTPLEQEWGRRLIAHKPGPCLEAEELMELAVAADMIALSDENKARMDHVVVCPTCRGLLLELRDVEELRKKALQTRTPWRTRLASIGSRTRLRGEEPQSGDDDTRVPPAQEQISRRAPVLTPQTRFVFEGVLVVALLLAGLGVYRRYSTSRDLAATRRQLVREAGQLATAQREKEGLLEKLTRVQSDARALSASNRQIASLRHELDARARDYKTATAAIVQRDKQLQIARAESSEALTPEDRQVVQSVIKRRKFDLPHHLQIAFAAEVSRDTNLYGRLTLNGPANTVVISDAPRFSWQPTNGATKYEVVVREDERNPDYDSRFKIAGTLGGTVWQPQPGKLIPGKFYVWQVTAYQNNNPVAQTAAHFAVADLQTLVHLMAVQERYRKRPLVLGILHAQAGLLDDAAREFRSALTSTASSADRQRARELLNSLDQLRSESKQ